MCVRRIEAIRKIFRPAIGQKESLAPEFVTTTQRGLGFRHKLSGQSLRTLRLCGEFFLRLDRERPNDPRQATQHERRMKVIAPRLIVIGAISPRTILALSPDDVTRGACPPIDQLVFSS